MNPDVLQKLQKILARAEAGRGASEAEMQTAMALAQKIAAEHGLDLASIGPAQEKQTIETDRKDMGYRAGREKTEHEYIKQVLIACFDVMIVRYGVQSFVVIGERVDVQIAQYCHGFLENQFSKLMRQFIREVRQRTGYGTLVEQHSFYNGLSEGIIAGNRKVKQQVMGQSYALVLADKSVAVKARLAAEFPQLRTREVKRRDFDPQAAHHGLEQGRKIKLQHVIA
jgi:hypothetical protein